LCRALQNRPLLLQQVVCQNLQQQQGLQSLAALVLLLPLHCCSLLLLLLLLPGVACGQREVTAERSSLALCAGSR
jgi:hypothetical protein